MEKYHKIQTVFLRDPLTKYKTLLEQFSEPEFEILSHNAWEWEEKIDGTNIRVVWKDGKVEFRGKTDNASIPKDLNNWLRETFTQNKMENAFNQKEVCLYGEGCGPKIQKGGGGYGSVQRMILFDVKIGHLWLTRQDVRAIAEDLGVECAPHIGIGSLLEMIAKVKTGFNSKYGDFRAEGIIARPVGGMLTRSGQRIIAKLKCKDFDATK